MTSQQTYNKQTTTNNKDKKENNAKNVEQEPDYFFPGNKKITGRDKLIELKEQNPIIDVANRLGLNAPSTGATTAVKCFKPNHKDDKPSLVLKPQVNKFECMACGIKGDVLDLIQGVKGIDFKGAVIYLNPNFYKSLLKKSAAKDYLEERGITKETQEKFGLKNQGNTLAIPISEGFNVYRHFDGNRKFSCTKGKSPVIYKAGYTFENVICFTEGIMDAIKLWQETGRPCWSLSHGGALTFKDSFLEEFKEIETVYIVYDNDKEGQNGALVVREKLGKDICKIVQLPGGVKDITEYFQKGFSSNDFETLLANSV
ncbi:MAG: primase protein [Candidatus Daviesbacteria bacterium GW2011_GWB1_41_5]|uniref:Primase protein n=1 Tax=Candidatus Daviesbacteria bacterium GW2011_GWB1_41_5 TaxID=1618429 RepID=A0A0G0WP09_9BACT|nr:MAG: primase protein [Candidatus Daviesbacteria bacterium GW2011_GWB1_41_5]